MTEAPSGVFKFTGDATSPFRFLEIEDYTRLGGISLNKANSTTPVKIETSINTAGPITINGGDLTIDSDLTTSSGGVTLQSAGKLALGANDTSMRIASGNTPITLKSDWIAFDGSATAAGNGQTTLASTGILTIAPFNANFSADFLGGSDGSSGSELNWNGALTEVSSGVFQFTGDGSNDFRHLVIEDYTRLGGLVLNKNNSSTPVEIETNMDFNGPITVYGGDLTIEENLSSRLEELRDDFRVVSQRPQGISQQRFTAALQQIDTRLEELESSIAYGLAENNGGGVSPQAFERLRRDIGRDLAPIAETVDELESALVALQSEQRNAMPARAASFVLASGNLVTAARSSKPFGTEMNAVQALAPTGPEAKDILNRLAQYAERGAPTASELAAQLGHQAGDALAAIRMNEEQSTLEQTIGRLQSLITVRQAPGEVEGDTPPALLARAEYRLQNGDVEAAYALTDRLPEPAIEALADWREQALRRISVDEALSQLIALSASTAEAEQ